MIAIKNISMPKSCSDCPMCHPKGKDEPWNFCCFATMTDINIDEFDSTRSSNCPIVELDTKESESKE